MKDDTLSCRFLRGFFCRFGFFCFMLFGTCRRRLCDWLRARRAQLSGLGSSRRDSAHAVCWVCLHPRYFLHPLHFGAAMFMWVKVMWLFIVEYLLLPLLLMSEIPDPAGLLTPAWPQLQRRFPHPPLSGALIIDSPFYYIQNEDVSNQDSESEQAGEDKGSACPRGPRGPAGPPGIEVGSHAVLQVTPTACGMLV